MNKVICDICGTSYPETADQCPICGYSRDSHIEPLAADEDFLLGEDLDLTEVGGMEKEVSGVTDELDTESDETELDENVDENGEDEEQRGPSALLIVLLVIVIVALLAVTGFIFVKYYLPGMSGDETVPSTVETTVEPTEETAAPTVPCTSLVMTSNGEVTLEQPGNNWLINIVVMPEDTTDAVIYMSSDESVATVDASGKVTAVGEGQAVITVSCGAYQLTCDVVCDFVEETTVPDVTDPVTEPSTEAPTEEPTEEPTEAPTEEPTEEPTEAPTEAPTEPEKEPVTDVVLKLNKSDISFDRVGVYYTLKVSEGIDPKDCEWITSHGGVCVVKDGVVTITGPGMAKITCKYQGQEASCLIRVSISSGSTATE